jgi:hypothetical protein
MKKGSFFGEIALLDEECRRTCDVESVTYTNLSVLSKADLEDAFNDFPEQKEFFKLVSEFRLSQGSTMSIKQIVDAAHEQMLKNVRSFHLFYFFDVCYSILSHSLLLLPLACHYCRWRRICPR